MKRQTNLIEKQVEFTHFMTILISFLKQKKNLFQSLEESRIYLTNNLSFEIQNLLEQKSTDSTLQPYLDFATYFQDDQITKICILLYQYEQSGLYIEAIQRFLPLLDQLKQSLLDAQIKREESKLNAYLLIPIISVIVLTVYFAFGLLSILVVSTNGP